MGTRSLVYRTACHDLVVDLIKDIQWLHETHTDMSQQAYNQLAELRARMGKWRDARGDIDLLLPLRVTHEIRSTVVSCKTVQTLPVRQRSDVFLAAEGGYVDTWGLFVKYWL